MEGKYGTIGTVMMEVKAVEIALRSGTCLDDCGGGSHGLTCNLLGKIV